MLCDHSINGHANVTGMRTVDLLRVARTNRSDRSELPHGTGRAMGGPRSGRVMLIIGDSWVCEKFSKRREPPVISGVYLTKPLVFVFSVAF